ncbi:MAG: type IV secretion system protein, partial [Sphingomonas bacterium]|nr:type IV secretion system protein [Sphingomonas bacterium]
MTVVCSGPDTSLGVAYRLSEYLDCQARALGENGFQALAGGAMGTAILSAMVTVFIALIGYKLLLGHVPDARDGVGWAVRLGIVLALVTSWPAFQALVYRVAVDAPPDIAAVLLPASGLAGESLAERVQQSYDTLRLGLDTGQPAAAAQAGQPPAAQQVPPLLEPLKKTASLLVISTVGLAGALRIAIGFLLAVAPLAIMSLLFRGTNGLFIGWVRALAGAALGLVGATVVTAIHLVVVESELAHLAAWGGGPGGAPPPPPPPPPPGGVFFFFGGGGAPGRGGD